jgi:hypothetical protein
LSQSPINRTMTIDWVAAKWVRSAACGKVGALVVR